MAYGFGKKSISMTPFGMSRGGYYVPGEGYHSREIQTTLNDIGERVMQTGGALRNDDGTLHAAYGSSPGTRIASLIAKQRAGFPLTDAELAELRAFWAKNPTNGLTNINNYGGGGILTKPGTKQKKTTDASDFKRVERKKSPEIEGVYFK